MSTMYSRSVVMLEQAKTALGKVGDDEAYLDAACFETQQALEFLLKAVLLEHGTTYEKTHDIRYLMELADKTGFRFDEKKHDALDLLADTITDWEEGSRYGSGVRTSVQTVQRVHNIYHGINEAFLALQAKNNLNQ